VDHRTDEVLAQALVALDHAFAQQADNIRETVACGRADMATMSATRVPRRPPDAIARRTSMERPMACVPATAVLDV